MNKIVIFSLILSITLFAQCIGWVKKPPKYGAYCWDVFYKEFDKNQIEIFVDVYGFPQNKPEVTFEHRYLKLQSQKDIPNRLGILNFTRYKFLMPKNKQIGWLRVKNYNKVKKSLQIKPF